MIQAGPGRLMVGPYDCFDYRVYVEYYIMVDMLLVV